MNIYIKPSPGNISEARGVPVHWMGLQGSPPIKIFEKLASQSRNLIMLFHRKNQKNRRVHDPVSLCTRYVHKIYA